MVALTPQRVFEFFSKVETSKSGCWRWTGAINSSGYATYQGTSAFRVIYEWCGLPIPEDHQIDHLCRNRACVNPLHLEAVTQSENIRRAIDLKVHCKNGHPITTDTVRYWKGTNGKPARYCLPCRRASRQRSASRKAA